MQSLDDRDVLSYVFGFLEAHELGRCARVCRAWGDVSSSDALWLPFVRYMARYTRPWRDLFAIIDGYPAAESSRKLRDIYVKRCWMNPLNSAVKASRVLVNVDTGRATSGLPVMFCVHVVRGPISMSDREASSAAAEAHKRALTECSNPRKRKFSAMRGKRCYLDRSALY